MSSAAFWRLPCFAPCFSEDELRLMEKMNRNEERQHQHAKRDEEQEKLAKPAEPRRPPLRYAIDFAKMPPGAETTLRLRRLFVPLNFDADTRAWLRDGNGAPAHWLRQGLSDVLTRFVGRTSANGVAFTGQMHVFSAPQLRKLLLRALAPTSAIEEGEAKEHTAVVVVADEVARDLVFDAGALARYNLDAFAAPQPRSLGDAGSSATAAAAAASGGSSANHAEAQGDEGETKISAEERRLLVDLKQRARAFDIGSGDGDGPTSVLAQFFASVAVSEDNAMMRLRLMKTYGVANVYNSEQCTALLRGGAAATASSAAAFDVISLFNVLDRCDKPLSLLRDIHAYMTAVDEQKRKERETTTKKKKEKSQTAASSLDKCLFVVATVLPWCPFVEDGTKQRKPSEGLEEMQGATCGDGASFERSLERLLRVFERVGFRLRCWTRLPYLSPGDDFIAYFALDDSVMILEAV